MSGTAAARADVPRRGRERAHSPDARGSKLSTRLAAAMVALALLTAAAVGLLIYRNLEGALVPAELKRLEELTRRRAIELESHAATARAQVLVILDSAPIDGIVRAAQAGGVDPIDASTMGQWRARLERNLTATMGAYPAYDQIRLILDDGRELVRAERFGNFAEARIVPENELQTKADTEYFKETIRLPPGFVYVSPIELNREHGAIQTPYVPVLRVAVPVYGVSDRPFGILVINVDLRPIFSQLRESRRTGEKVYVLNERGDYLLHPDPAREFGFELGRTARVQNEFPELAAIVGSPDRPPARMIRDAAGERVAAAVVPVRLAHGPWGQVIATLPEAVILAPVAEVRRINLIAGSAAALVALALGIWLARSLTRPLARMTAAVAAFSGDGEARIAAPTGAGGEIGILAQAFERMAADVRDKTEALKTEAEERRRAAGTLQAMIDESPVAITGLDAEKRVSIWNRTAERVFGWTAAEVVGKPNPAVPPEEKGQFEDLFARSAAGERLRDIEVRRRRKDGKPLEILLSRSPLYGPGGRFCGVVSILEDVTEKRQVERLLQQSQKMETVGQLAGGMAHDFNNMLAVVIGNLDLLTDLPGMPDRGKEMANTALEAGLRGAELTRRLLSFSRRQPLQPKAVQINDLVSGMTRMLARTLGERIAVDLRLAQDLWSARVDPAQLESALANLAVNARDAMAGNGRLTVETRNGHLDDHYVALHPGAAVGDYVVLSVSDTGCGIPPENLERVFEPFFTTKEAGKGTGLGLSMVYGFVKQSGGHVNVYSEVGVGTTIRIYLPRCESISDAPSAGIPDELMRGRGERILVVEDNSAVRQISVRLIDNLGYRAREVESAAEALQVLQNGEPVDLLFTDIVMPGGMTGIELAEKACACRPGLKVLFATGFAGGVHNGGQVPDFGMLLTKPYRQPELARALHDLLAGRSQKP